MEENFKPNQNKDLFIRKNYEFLIQSDISPKVMDKIEEEFNVRKVVIIEPKIKKSEIDHPFYQDDERS
jgi:hypothetical protein